MSLCQHTGINELIPDLAFQFLYYLCHEFNIWNRNRLNSHVTGGSGISRKMSLSGNKDIEYENSICSVIRSFKKAEPELCKTHTMLVYWFHCVLYCSAWCKLESKEQCFGFGPKQNTKVTLETTTTHPPKTFKDVPGKLKPEFLWGHKVSPNEIKMLKKVPPQKGKGGPA